MTIGPYDGFRLSLVFPAGVRALSALCRAAFQRASALSRAGVALWLGVLLSFAPAIHASAKGDPYADQLHQKAGLIASFLRNFTWPEKRFIDADAPFVVGVIGRNEIGPYLQEAFQDRLVSGRRVQVRRLSRFEELRACHLVFVEKTQGHRLRQILGRLRRTGVLTVSDCDNFLASGGVIQFINFAGQVRYQLSLQAARRERVEPNGFVLRMAAPQSSGVRVEDRRIANGQSP